MVKERLLAISHFRKNRSTSIGLLALIIIAALLLTISLLTIFDAQPAAKKETKRLNAGDGLIRIYDSEDVIDDECLDKILADDTKEYEIKHDGLVYSNVTVPFADGTIGISLTVDNKDAFDSNMNRIEIVKEDKSITSDYIYLPYQFYTLCNTKIGDMYSFTLNGKKYDLKVRGFHTSAYDGCNNIGSLLFVLDDNNYNSLLESDSVSNKLIRITYKLKDGVKNASFNIRVANEIKKINGNILVGCDNSEEAVFYRSFMPLIIAVSLIVIACVVLIIIMLMLANTITNYIRENMKTIGALKAIGYTGNNIKVSLLIMFMALAGAGSIIGIILGYVLMPIVATVVVAQMGVPYNMCFNLGATFIPLVSIVLFVFAITIFATRKIGKIEPIIALRDGINSHNFKKNRVRLDKSAFSLNISLALKTMFTNIKQNIITFFVIGFIVFTCTMGLLMYENFNRKIKLELFTLETCGGVLGFDVDTKEEAEKYLRSRDDIYNVRRVIDITAYYKDEEKLSTNIFEDATKINNKNVCYEGRLPKHDNEIAVSGKFVKDYDLSVGDEIPLNYGDKEYSYIITGLIQTTNNNGREAIMNEDAAEHILDFTNIPGYLWFDCDGKKASSKVISECEDKYGEHLISSMNFYEVIEGSMTTFKSIAVLMLIMVCVISAIVILLVLYLLIKSYLYNKRKDFGIYKAIGYTSNSLIIQTALSFMPSIVVSVIVFSVVSYYTANPYMNFFMSTFGIVKCTFDIPVIGLVIIGVGITVIAFGFAVLRAGKIRKIEAYNMLLCE